MILSQERLAGGRSSPRRVAATCEGKGEVRVTLGTKDPSPRSSPFSLGRGRMELDIDVDFSKGQPG
jgi:hypothetical protein